MEPPTRKIVYFCEECGLTRDFPIGHHRSGRLGIWGAECPGKAKTKTYILNEKVTA